MNKGSARGTENQVYITIFIGNHILLSTEKKRIVTNLLLENAFPWTITSWIFHSSVVKMFSSLTSSIPANSASCVQHSFLYSCQYTQIRCFIKLYNMFELCLQLCYSSYCNLSTMYAQLVKKYNTSAKWTHWILDKWSDKISDLKKHIPE